MISKFLPRKPSVAILKTLDERRRTVSELSRALNLSKPTILYHMRILEKCWIRQENRRRQKMGLLRNNRLRQVFAEMEEAENYPASGRCCRFCDANIHCSFAESGEEKEYARVSGHGAATRLAAPYFSHGAHPVSNRLCLQ